MIWEVPEGFPAAADSSRPAGSIGDVRFKIWSDYTNQAQFQSSDVYTFRPQKSEKNTRHIVKKY